MKRFLLFPIHTVLTAVAGSLFFLGKKIKTRKPVSDIPVKSKRFNRNIQTEVLKLESTVIDGDLGLFKNNALIGIEIQGKIISGNGEPEFFDEITLIEHVLYEQDASAGHLIEIEMAPSFTHKKNKKDRSIYALDSSCIHFKTYIEHRLYTCGFGKNVVTFTMGDKKNSITLHQGK